MSGPTVTDPEDGKSMPNLSKQHLHLTDKTKAELAFRAQADQTAVSSTDRNKILHVPTVLIDIDILSDKYRCTVFPRI